MKQGRAQLFHSSIDNNTLRVSVLYVTSRPASIQNGGRRIDPAVQRLAVDAVRKLRAIARSIRVGFEVLQLGKSLARDDVISIEREHPRRADTGFTQSKLPLIAVTIKRALKHPHLRKQRCYLHRLVIAETIDDNDVARPAKPFQRAADVRRFVVRKNQWRDLLEHSISS